MMAAGAKCPAIPTPTAWLSRAGIRERRIASSDFIPKLDWFTLTHDHWIAGTWLAEGQIWTPLARTDFEGLRPWICPRLV